MHKEQKHAKKVFLLKPDMFKRHGFLLVLLIILLSIGLFILN